MSRQATARPKFFERPSATRSGASSCVSAMRLLLVRSSALFAAMTGGLPRLAIISVGADEHPAAGIVGHDLVEIGVLGAAQRTGRIEAVAREWMVLEIERHHLRVRRNGINALFAARPEQLQRRAIVHLRIVEFRRR